MATQKQQFQLRYDESALFTDNYESELYFPVRGLSSDQENLNNTELENDFR